MKKKDFSNINIQYGIDKRIYGSDFLRIVSMFFIIILHILGQGGILNNPTPLTANYKMAYFLETAAYCAVNCYALISGYVGISSKFKYSNIIYLWIQVVFYTVLITVVFAIVAPGTVNANTWVNAILPVSHTQYWYFSAYFCMFFFIPFFNFLITNLSKKHATILIITIFFLFSILPTIFSSDIFITANGYSSLWLSILYLMGAYIRKYNVFITLSKKILLGIYVLCIFITWGAKIGTDILTIKNYRFATYIPNLMDYTSPTILIAAIVLLVCFSRIQFSNSVKTIIRFFSPLTFSTYLIHAHPLIWIFVMQNRFHQFTDFSPIKLLFSVLAIAFGIYLICSMLDFIRCRFFEILKIRPIATLLEKNLRNCFNKIL